MSLHLCVVVQTLLSLAVIANGQLTGDIRLNSFGTTSGISSGRVEIYYFGQWGTVCDDSFFSTDADVACRQLGFAEASSYGSVGTLGFSQGTDPTWLDEVTCSGTESRLVDCSRNAIGNEDCSHSEDIAVRCTGVRTDPVNGDIRLNSYGTTSGISSGRVEIYYFGEWGTVCDDSFFLTDADVACRQLGFSGASSYGRVGTLGFSQGNGEIWLDQVTCSGTESRLVDCSRNSIGVEDCSHSEDIAVRCGSSISTSTVSIGAGVGVTISIIVVIIIVVVMVSVIFCVRANKRNYVPRVTTVQPTATTVVAPTVTTYTTAPSQGTAYPTQQPSGYAAPPSGQYTSYPTGPQQAPAAYPTGPQQPPTAYPTEQTPYPPGPQPGEDFNPELYPNAPPGYGQAMNQYPPQDPGYAVPQQQPPQPQYY